MVANTNIIMKLNKMNHENEFLITYEEYSALLISTADTLYTSLDYVCLCRENPRPDEYCRIEQDAWES